MIVRSKKARLVLFIILQKAKGGPFSRRRFGAQVILFTKMIQITGDLFPQKRFRPSVLKRLTQDTSPEGAISIMQAWAGFEDIC